MIADQHKRRLKSAASWLGVFRLTINPSTVVGMMKTVAAVYDR
jgi:hypothetical protein